MDDNTTISAEHRLVRDLWAILDRERFTQKELRERMAALEARLAGEDAEVEFDVPSTSYLSQVLVRPRKMPESGEKQPSTVKLRSIVLGIADLVAERSSALKPVDRAEVQGLLDQALYALGVTLPTWQDGTAPLAADATNRLERVGDRAVAELLDEYNRPFILSVMGGPKFGKTTLLYGAVAHAARLGYRSKFVDLAAVFSTTRDEPSFWAQLSQRIGVPGAINSANDFTDGLLDVVAKERSRMLVAFDGVNPLLERPPGASVADWWGELALAQLTRFMMQEVRRAPAGSPLKRLSLLFAGTFSALDVPRPTMNSLRILHDQSVKATSLLEDEAVELLARHVAHAGRKNRDAAQSPAPPLRLIAEEACAYFGGHPMLLQDYFARWVAAGRELDHADLLRAPSPVLEEFTTHLARQAGGDRQREETLLAPAAVGGTSTTVLADLEPLQVMDLVLAGRWAAPYLVDHLVPKLQPGARS